MEKYTNCDEPKHTCVVEKRRKRKPRPKQPVSIFDNCGEHKTSCDLLFPTK
jgi:hypothetical protein